MAWHWLDFNILRIGFWLSWLGWIWLDWISWAALGRICFWNIVFCWAQFDWNMTLLNSERGRESWMQVWLGKETHIVIDALVVHVLVAFPLAKSTNPVRLNLIQSCPIKSNPIKRNKEEEHITSKSMPSQPSFNRTTSNQSSLNNKTANHNPVKIEYRN